MNGLIMATDKAGLHNNICELICTRQWRRFPDRKSEKLLEMMQTFILTSQ